MTTTRIGPRRGPGAGRVALAVAVALLGAGACTSGDEGAANRSTTSAAPTVPSECAGFEPGVSTTSAVPPRCLDTVFAQTLGQIGSAELKELSEKRRVSLGRGLCDYAGVLLASQQELPAYREFLTSTGASWGVEPQSVDEIATAAAVLCPDQIRAIDTMREARQPVAVELRVDGKGKADITYTLPDGSSQPVTADAPWSQTLYLATGIDVALTVQGDERLTCSVSIGEKELVQHRAGDSGSVACNVTAADIDRAALLR